MKRLCKIILFTAILCFFCSSANAGEHGHRVFGSFCDFITYGSLPVKVTLMRADSTVIDTLTTSEDDDNQFRFTISKVGKYILKAVSEGYETAYHDFSLRSNREGDLYMGYISMYRKAQALPEVTVNATKIKMVTHGDTIVYNADAFNLPDGSMLDALVKRLPGASLTKDGQIFVNGKYVQSLLVNGKGFFSGNPSIALENLPAYVVSKIKVYDKHLPGPKSFAGSNAIYTMDVRLKKEYETGYLGNVEGGVGTKDRYSAKGLMAQFSDVRQVAVFGNANNLSESQKAQASGEWTPQRQTEGLLATKSAGVSYSYLPNDYASLSSENIISHTDADDETRTSRQTFLPGNDAFARNFGKQTVKATRFNSHSSYNKTKGMDMVETNLDVDYTRNQGHRSSRYETLDSLTLLNSNLSLNSSEDKRLNVNLAHKGVKTLIADMLQWDAKVGYDYLKADNFSLDDIQYTYRSQPRDRRNYYLHSDNHQWNLKGYLSYSYQMGQATFTLGYGYEYLYNKADNPLYRLDRLANIDSTKFDLLPTSADELAHVMDAGNSYSLHEYHNIHAVAASAMFLLGSNRQTMLFLGLPVRIVNQKLYYLRNGRHDVARRKTFPEPRMNLNHNYSKGNLSLTLTMSSAMPDMVAMADYYDDANPLLIRKGNPDLKNNHTYSATARWSPRLEKMRLDISADYKYLENAMAFGESFNRSTGITTLQPVSVNGNWTANGEILFNGPLNKKQSFTFDNHFATYYNHNVDMATAEGSHEAMRSIVNNWHLSDNVKLNYRPNDDYEVTLHAGGDYYHIAGKQPGFNSISAGSFNVGTNATIALPWQFRLSTDMTMYARRGWQTDEMNTTDWVWNAQLSRSFCKGHLLARLQGFDMLHQLSSTQYAVNAQGRTETWHNSLPRYGMLSLMWKFNINP